MCPLQRLFQVILGAAGYYLLLERDVLVQYLPQSQHLGLLLVIHQRQQYNSEGGLHLGLGK